MKRYAPYALLLAGVALLVAGALTGGGQIVMRKAVRVCLECIGLGV